MYCMMRIKYLSVVLLTMGVVALSASMSHADTYSVFSTIHGFSGGAFGAHITESTETIRTDMPKFNTSLGTLRQIDVRFDFLGLASAQMQHHIDEDTLASPLSGHFNYT